VTGAIVVTSDVPFTHSGVKLVAEGQVTLQLSARSIGLFEAFSSALKPIPLLHTEIDVNAGSKVPKGSTPFPFEFVLRAVPGQQLFDTYHGVYINIQYTVNVSLQRGMMQRPLTKQKEILIEMQSTVHLPSTDATPSTSTPALKGPLNFQVSPSSLQNIKESNKRKGQRQTHTQHHSTIGPLRPRHTADACIASSSTRTHLPHPRCVHVLCP
jgi:hypothetical protein